MTYPAQKTSPSPGGSPWRLPQLRHRVAVPLVTVLLVATVGRLLVVSPEITHGETALLEGLVQYRNAVFDAIAMAVQAVLSNAGIVLIIAMITGGSPSSGDDPWTHRVPHHVPHGLGPDRSGQGRCRAPTPVFDDR
ncbi:hypothetical protein ACFOLD_16855 [Kocuria carniphila]|uniref:hypothetical protein n=1 Tax=Kocuria carniphila TaxID=262208 RepID=UPI0036083B47